MQADGLVFTDEKTDVPEIYKLSETHGMNWYDTYLLAKKDSREPPDYCQAYAGAIRAGSSSNIGW